MICYTNGLPLLEFVSRISAFFAGILCKMLPWLGCSQFLRIVFAVSKPLAQNSSVLIILARFVCHTLHSMCNRMVLEFISRIGSTEIALFCNWFAMERIYTSSCMLYPSSTLDRQSLCAHTRYTRRSQLRADVWTEMSYQTYQRTFVKPAQKKANEIKNTRCCIVFIRKFGTSSSSSPVDSDGSRCLSVYSQLMARVSGHTSCLISCAIHTQLTFIVSFGFVAFA